MKLFFSAVNTLGSTFRLNFLYVTVYRLTQKTGNCFIIKYRRGPENRAFIFFPPRLNEYSRAKCQLVKF